MNLYNADEMVNKELTFRNKRYTIESWSIAKVMYNIERVLFKLKLVKGRESTIYHISTKAFEDGTATTTDEELLEFVKKSNIDFNASWDLAVKEEQKAKEREMLAKAQRAKEEAERQQLYLAQQAKLGAKQGKEDARNKVSALYRLFNSHTYKDLVKADRYTRQFRNAYCIAYEDEKKLMKQERLVRTRALNDTLDSYPGDLEELIKWMKKNLLRIDVYASPDKIENEQSAIDVVNERDGTNYQVKLRQGQYVAYEAHFKNPASAPAEFLSWKVSKHDYTTSDLSKRVMATPMNVETGKMTCNSIVKELVYSLEYAFNVGKYIGREDA